MKIRRLQSIFTKMTMFFITFGMVPIVIISMIFFHWYYSDVEEATISNYTQITEYLERNLSSVISQVDDTSGYMYDFYTAQYEHLYELLLDEESDKTENKIYINSMMQDMLMSSEYISGIRFYTAAGDVYALFRKQGKSLKNEGKILNEVNFSSADLQKMVLMPAILEADYCTNSEECVFSVVRNYMNPSSVKSIEENCLGTLYIDINVKDIQTLVETVNVGELGNIYIVNLDTNQWIFGGENSIANELKAEKANTVVSGEDYWYFCQPLSDTGYYVVTQVFAENVLNTYLKNRIYVIVVLGLAIIILTIAYTVFSERMNEPAKKLKWAMEQVQKGDLQVQVDIHTDDEMEYLGEGFNKMVKDLQYNIEQVYVANIHQKEAELNALKMQIQPHYLYNTLDVIRMTAIDHDDTKTARLLESLAKQLRYVIGQQREKVPLYMELNNIQEYIVLLNARYADKFQLNVNISDEERDLYVLKLLLQPIVENCIMHGLIEKEGIGTVEVNIKRFDTYLEIIVMDDGVGMSKEQEECIRTMLDKKKEIKKPQEREISIGFKNVYNRIKLSCGEEYGFTITSYENIGTRVRFKLPIWEGDADVEDGNSR